MNRFVTALVTTAVAGAVLAGCGGDSPYCAAVKENQAALDSFGQKRTTAGFTTYDKAVRAIRKTAPDEVKDDWTRLDKVTRGVISAHKKAGIPLEDMSDADKVASLGSDELEVINKAYEAFNDTAAQRKAVVDDVESSCKITLK